jgi:ferredoxin
MYCYCNATERFSAPKAERNAHCCADNFALHAATMAKIVIEPQAGTPMEFESGGTASIADLCDTHHAPVPFSCRSASCGTCRCEVLEGRELLSKPEDEELDVLDMLGAPKTHRLACCAQLSGSAGVVRLRPINEY